MEKIEAKNIYIETTLTKNKPYVSAYFEDIV